MNFNELKIPSHNIELKNVTYDENCLYDTNIKDHLIEKILKFKDGFIFGCVAWLNDHDILNALAECSNVQILIQKDHKIKIQRYDLGAEFGDTNKPVQMLYKKLRFSNSRFRCHHDMSFLNMNSNGIIDPIRTVGVEKIEQKSWQKYKNSKPLMHHKFLVFCKKNEKRRTYGGDTATENDLYIAVGLWNGSFNFTKNASKSFENATYFQKNDGSSEMINGCLKTHHDLFTISESLAWGEEYGVHPDYKIGS